MKKIDQIKTDYFLEKLEDLWLFELFFDCFSDIEDELYKEENQNPGNTTFADDFEQQNSGILLEYLQKYIGTTVPISATEFSATVKRIEALRRDIAATDAPLDRWGIDTRYIWDDVCHKIESAPVEDWAERTAKQLQVSRLEAA